MTQREKKISAHQDLAALIAEWFHLYRMSVSEIPSSHLDDLVSQVLRQMEQWEASPGSIEVYDLSTKSMEVATEFPATLCAKIAVGLRTKGQVLYFASGLHGFRHCRNGELRGQCGLARPRLL